MRSINFLSIFLLFAAATPIGARQRTTAEKKNLAISALGLNATQNAMQKAASQTQLTEYVNNDALSIYGAEDAGFVVLSNDDNFTPVLGLSESDYKEGSMPCGFSWWLKTAEKALTEAQDNNSSPMTFSVSQKVKSFISTRWNQGSPFNTLCPTISNEHAPTGCIATAMSQIMKYYQYPTQGQGTGKYSVTVYKSSSDQKGTTTQYTRDLNNTYLWDEMSNIYYSYTQDPDNAVATLMADAGAASCMNYTASGSGSSDFYAARGFIDNFAYDSLSINRYNRSLYTDDEWMGMIENELTNKRPILYCGVDETDGGHAFLLDGIDTDGKVHVNWGWSGNGDGYYAIDVLQPVSLAGTPMVSGDGFNSSQSMLLGFKAQKSPDESEENTSLWLTDENTFYLDSNNQLHITLSSLYNYSCRYFKGNVSVVIENTSSKEQTDLIDLVETENKETVPMLYGYVWGTDDSAADFNLNEEGVVIAPGAYRLFVGSKSTGESTYKCIRGIGGEICYTLTVAKDATMSLTNNNTSAITQVSDITPSASPYTYIYNMQGQEIYSGKTADFNSSLLPANGMYIMKQGNKTVKIAK